jgi:Zn-dependent metalloprotease
MQMRLNAAKSSLWLALVACGAVAADAAAAPAPGAAHPGSAAALHAAQALEAVRVGTPALAASGVGLAMRSFVVNEKAQTIVRAQQTWQGSRVWGSWAIVQASANGTAQLRGSSLSAQPTPAGSPRLTQQQAIDIALKSVALKGLHAPPRCELVVFPTQYHARVALTWNPAKLEYTLDRRRSALSIPPADPYVWAYDVHVFAKNRVDGVQDWDLVVDARTGAIMRADNGLRTLLPPNPPTQRVTDAPARGIGHSQYSGDVPIDATRHLDGTYALIDPTRGSLYNPFLHDSYYDYSTPTPTQILDADGNPIHAIGLQTLTETHEGFDPINGAAVSDWWYDGNPTNTWGDGKQFVMYPFGGETSANGQTAAVDAHFGMATTWDFYGNVFGRNGIDNLGTSPISEVHILGPFGYYDNAFWDDYVFGMFYSDGTRYAGVDPFTGQPTTPDPLGFSSVTELDVIGHEMTHGVTSTSAGLIYDGESGGLNEGTSDILGKMVETYHTRSPGTDAQIPLTGTNWILGHDLTPGGLRSFRQPSSDGLSADNWYAGIKYLDVHFSSGPLNRWFYYLSQGAPSTVVDTAYSKYLPQGMTGIGNDHAARIWYKALTEYLPPDADYAVARSSAVSAATDLYGAGSPEVKAVKAAFAAINVGTPTDAPRITIDMPLVHPPGSALNPYGNGFFAQMPIVSMSTTVQLAADVRNTTNTKVTWQLGNAPGAFNNPGFRQVGGIVTADGHWTPDNNWGFHAMTVVSDADPLEYAEGVVWVINGDADADTQFDAIDLGGVALSWGLTGYVNSSHAIVADGFVDSLDVAAIVEAFRNAFGGK